ncbi:MAG: hypothetical protein QNJ60_09260 [Xenococcaceae cyanobacterium MO_188.B19]|nr:hypothetical protein [Xenococcaceae cyanobacterium MO_188.B19]
MAEFRAKRLKESIKQLLGEDSLIIENGSAYISGFWDANKKKFQESSRDFNSLKDRDKFYFENNRDYNNLQNPKKIKEKEKLNIKEESYIWFNKEEGKIVSKKPDDSEQKVEKRNVFIFEALAPQVKESEEKETEGEGTKEKEIVKKEAGGEGIEEKGTEEKEAERKGTEAASNLKEVKSLTELLYEKSLIHSLNQSSTSIWSLVGFSQKRPGLPWIVRGAVTLTLITIFLSILFPDFTRWTIIIAVVLIIFVLIGIINLVLSLSSPQPINWSALRKNRKSKGPSYIKPELFSQALLEVIQDNLEGKHKLKKSDLIASSENNNNLLLVEKLKKIKFYSPAISNLIQIAESLILEKQEPKLSDFKAKLEELFKEAQERSSGVYKRNAKGVSFFLGLFLVMIANADAFYIVSNLSKDNNSFSNRLVNELDEKLPETGSDQDQSNSQYGLTDEQEKVIRNVLDEVGTLPLGWNFDRELESQNLNSLIEILEKKTKDTENKEKSCFEKNAENTQELTEAQKTLNEQCFTKFLEEIEKNPHLGSYVQQDKDAKQFIEDLSQVQNCLKSEKKKAGECLQKETYDFPKTYGEYRQHLKNRRLSQRIGNIKTPNKIDVANQVSKQGGWWQVMSGWVVSAIAISMGAPFWFDLLGKVMNVRNAGKPISEKNNVEKTKETQEET